MESLCNIIVLSTADFHNLVEPSSFQMNVFHVKLSAADVTNVYIERRASLRVFVSVAGNVSNGFVTHAC